MSCNTLLRQGHCTERELPGYPAIASPHIIDPIDGDCADRGSQFEALTFPDF
jgi:hypothetical protein